MVVPSLTFVMRGRGGSASRSGESDRVPTPTAHGEKWILQQSRT